MTHPLVLQLRFTRSEFKRALEDVSEADACRRIEPMNCISWIIAHLAWHEQLCWLKRAQNQILVPELNELAGFGKPASTPPLSEAWQAWHTVTQASEAWLETVTSDLLTTHWVVDGKQHRESIGSVLRRVTYHYWYHIGESQAIRQMLAHTNLPVFVGAIHDEAPYIPE